MELVRPSARTADTDAPEVEATRIWAAPRPSGKAVRRSRLHAVLDGAERRPLTSIVAAAGTGKTTLAALWAAEQAERGRPVVWLSARHHGDLEPALRFARGCSTWAPADVLVADLAAANRPPQLVVVDDAHLLSEARRAVLHRVLLECPDAVRLLLLARHDPALPLVQLGLPGAAVTVGARQLRFEGVEVEQLARAHAPTCTRRDIEELVELSGGWATPLVIGARSLAASPDDVSARLRRELTEQPVLDYVFGELLETTGEPVRSLLLACCQERDVDAVSASALSGVLDAERHCTALAEEGLLVTGRTDRSRPGGTVWQMLPLLRELLRRRTAPTGPDWQVVVDAHVRASRRYAQDGKAVLALRHAHRSGDATAVQSVLVEYGASFVAAEASEEVAAGLLCLPDGIKRSTPHLLALEALLHRARGRVDRALSMAQQAFATAADAGPQRGPPSAGALAILAEVRVWWSMVATGDSEAAAADARRLLGCAVSGDRHTHSRSELTLGQSASLMIELAALEIWHGDLAAAATHVHEAERAAGVLGWAALTGAALVHRCMLEFAAGQYGTAADTASAALRADAGRTLPPDLRARAHLVRGWAATYELDPRTAVEALDHVTRLAPAVDPVVRALTPLLRCRLMSQDGDHDGALRLLAVADGAAAPLFLVRLTEIVRAETAARSRAIPAVREAALRLRRLGLVDDADLFDCLAPVSAAAAHEVLERLLTRPGLRPATAAGAATVRMCMVLQQRDLARARALLPDLVGRVRPQRLFFFLDIVARTEPDFLHLLYDDLEEDTRHPASAEALALLRRTHRPLTADPFVAVTGGQTSGRSSIAAVVGRGTATQPSVQLTRRQADVLAQLALGGSYRDIAEALYLTVNSVKTHLRGLYRTLGVTRRSDALRRARELGLL